MNLVSLWRDHSLTITCFALGTLFTLIGWAFHDEGKAFDTWLSYGVGLSTVALFYTLSGYFREKNKPEDPV